MADALPLKINLDVVTPTGPVFSSQVDWITAPGVLGDVGVLPGHVPLLSGLKHGTVSFRRQGETFVSHTGDGFIEVGPSQVIVLVESFERAEIYALRALLEWQTHFEAEPLRNAIARADTRQRDLELKGQDKSEEYLALMPMLEAARARLEKR